MKNAIGVFPHFVIADSSDVSGKAAQQPVFHIRMQVQLKVVPVRVLASNNQLFVPALVVSLLQMLSDILEVV